MIKGLAACAFFLAGTALAAPVRIPLQPMLTETRVPIPIPLPPIRILPIVTVKVPYKIQLTAKTGKDNVAAQCSLEYRGVVLANQTTQGSDTFTFEGSFVLNGGVPSVQMRCKLDGYAPLVESVAIADGAVKYEKCLDALSLFQDPRVDLATQNAQVRLKIPVFKQQKIVINGRPFIKLLSDDEEIFSSSYTGEPLLPEVPMASFVFALPIGASVTGISVKPGKLIGTQTTLLVPKADEGATEYQGDVPPRFDEKIYFEQRPEISVVTDTHFQVLVDKESNLVKVTAPLVDFQSKKQLLRFYEDLNVSIQFKSDSRCFRAPYRGRDQVDLYRSRTLVGIHQQILNASDYLAVCRQTEPRSSMDLEPRATTISAGPNLVIVTNREFAEQAEVLRLHKETLGIRTAVLLWEGVAAADLKEKLAAAASNLRPNFMQWVLLLGDVDAIPTWYDQKLGDPQNGDYALSAGDVYYTQFPDNPELYTPSLDPKFSIGRIPAHNVTEMKMVIARIMDYENNPPISDTYYQTPVIAATLQMANSVDTGLANNYAEFMEKNVAGRYLRAGYRPERIFRTDTEQALKPVNWSPSNPIDYATLTQTALDQFPQTIFHIDGSQEQIDEAMKRGTGILINRGHATVNYWAWPGYAYDPQRFALFPSQKPPLVFALSCLTGFFDSETIQHDSNITDIKSDFNHIDPNGRYMAEQWLLSPNGSLGVVAASRQSVWAYNNRLALGLARSLIDRQSNGNPMSQRVGDVMVDAKVFAKKITGSLEEAKFLEKTNRHHLLVYNLLGDPSLEVRQAVPTVVRGNPTLKYDNESKTLSIRFRMESISCPACDLSLQKEPALVVLMDSRNTVINRALANVISSANGENREVLLSGVTSYYGSLLKFYLSGSGLVPYAYTIDNIIK